MSATALALLGYVAWTLALILANEVLRTTLVLSGRRRADSFKPDGMDVSPFAHRVAQSSTHLVSTSSPAVTVRFSFFAVQLLIAVWWVVQLLT